MSLFFRGFLSYSRQVLCPVDGERYTEDSKTIQGDDINVAECVRRISRGEIVPMRELQYGVDKGEMDEIDTQQELAMGESPASAEDNSPVAEQKTSEGENPKSEGEAVKD